MRVGLIGTGKQGQRYLLEKNGGRHITVSGSRRIPLDDVDGVIIATHPAGHKELALECIAAGKAVLIEKPLALNLADCEEILDAAERAGVACEVAHTHLWARNWRPSLDTRTLAHIAYTEHSRDYSPWLDWGPHGIALVAAANTKAPIIELRESVCVHKADKRAFCVEGRGWYYLPESEPEFTPMWLMARDFVLHAQSAWGDCSGYWKSRIAFNRRVYRALFAE